MDAHAVTEGLPEDDVPADTGAADPARADAAPAWPVVTRARWHDPGYTRGELHALVGILLGLTWIVGVGIVRAEQPDPVVLLLPAALAAWIAYVWMRRRPGTIELELTPDGLHVTRDGVAPLDLEIPRAEAGWVVVASATAGSSERIVLLLDEPGNELGRFRAVIAPVEITVSPGTDPDAVAAWWDERMPPGTSPSAPPPVLPMSVLVGEWWPDHAHRIGLRNSGGRVPWLEPSLRDWPAVHRSHRRKAAVITAILMGALVALGVRAGTTTALIAVVPPAVCGAIAGAWRLFRR